MKNQTNPFNSTDIKLPVEIQTAINSVDLPEVQELIKQLGKYNLGVILPHKHNEATGDFEILPQEEIQMEDNLNVSFMQLEKAEKVKAIPVAWRWFDNGVTSLAGCVGGCTASSSQSGGDTHIKFHQTNDEK